MFYLRIFFFVFFVAIAASLLSPGKLVDAANAPKMPGDEQVCNSPDEGKEGGESIVVKFTAPAVEGIYSTEVAVPSTPASLSVLIESSAGSGGYGFMAHEVLRGIHGKPETQVQALPGDEMQERMKASITKHGVTISKPAIEHVNKTPGAKQNYVAKMDISEPGDFTAIFSMIRPWSPTDSPRYYVVHVRAK